MKKVMIGMSGGVDSSAAALILRNQGYDVVGVTLEMFHDNDIVCGEIHKKNNGNLSGAGDAEKVAEKLGFQHMTVDMKDCFRKNVMKYFCESYFSGKTPNPCIECNRHVKFGEMLKIAAENGCDYIATGHYAVCEYDAERGRYLLKRSADRSKDQTYMLYSLTQEQLAHTLFPLGDMEKSAVRELAEKNGANINRLKFKGKTAEAALFPTENMWNLLRNLQGKNQNRVIMWICRGKSLASTRDI